VFAAIVDAGSFSRASEQLGISKAPATTRSSSATSRAA